MRLLNPENNATIIGEAGDNIGLGGRADHKPRREARPNEFYDPDLRDGTLR